MPTEGPNSPGTLADDSSVGTATWSSPGNAASSNDVRASVSLNLSEQSHYIKATNFSFSVPDATILGVEVSVERKSTSASVADAVVSLVKGGTVQGDDKASATVWPSTEATESYGGIADLWGLPLSASED